MAKAKESMEIATRDRFSPAELRSIESFDDALALVGEEDIALAHKEIGEGFAILENKDALCGIPIMFVDWRFVIGDFGDFVTAHVLAQLPNGTTAKFIVNDGSTGIYRQLSDYTEATNKTYGLLAKNGLRRSDYHYTDPTTGEQHPASTYYIDTSA